jgi:hypothetical protein
MMCNQNVKDVNKKVGEEKERIFTAGVASQDIPTSPATLDWKRGYERIRFDWVSPELKVVRVADEGRAWAPQLPSIS